MTFMPLVRNYLQAPTLPMVAPAPVAVAPSKPVREPLPPRGPGWPIAEKRPLQIPRMQVGRGQTGEIVVLDRVMGPKLREHNWRHPVTGKMTMFDACVSAEGNCPLCERVEIFGKPRATMVLSAYDLGRYASEDPRTLLAFSTMAWLRMFEAHLAQHGTLEGMNIRLDRATDDASPIGTPTVLGITELSKLRRAVPYDYGILFPPQTPASLRRRYGGEVPIGSPEDLMAELTDADTSRD